MKLELISPYNIKLKEWLVPILLSLQFILCVLQLLDSLDLVYYPLIRRSTILTKFDVNYNLVFWMILLLLYWSEWMYFRDKRLFIIMPIAIFCFYPFSTLEIIVSIASFTAVLVGLWINKCTIKFVSGTLIILTFIESLALLQWLFLIHLGLKSPLQEFALFEMGLYHLSLRIAQLLSLPLMFIWVSKIYLISREKRINNIIIKKSEYKKIRYNALMLFLILLGGLTSMYPNLSSINPLKKSIGEDLPHYVEGLNNIISDPKKTFLDSNRPIIYLFLCGFQRLFGLSVQATVKYSPILLIPLLMATVYFLSSEIFDDERAATWACFFTLCGFQTIVGIFSFYLANILALSLVNLSLTFLIRTIKDIKIKSFIISSIFGILIVFTHPWTFAQYVIGFGLLYILILYESIREKKYLIVMFLTVYLLTMGLAEFLKSNLLNSLGGIRASSTAVQSLINVSDFWLENQFGFYRLYGGLMSNIILFLLAILGFFKIKNHWFFHRYFISFIIPSSLLFIISNNTIQTRLFYNIPWAIFSGYGFYWLIYYYHDKDIKKSLSIFIIISSLTYLFRSLVNIIPF